MRARAFFLHWPVPLFCRRRPPRQIARLSGTSVFATMAFFRNCAFGQHDVLEQWERNSIRSGSSTFNSDGTSSVRSGQHDVL